MKRWIHATTESEKYCNSHVGSQRRGDDYMEYEEVEASSEIEAKSRINPEIQKIIDKVAQKYQLLYKTPMDDYVLKGDSFAFKVNDHNVYRVVIDARDNTLYLQCIAIAWRNDDGKEYYDEAVDYKDEVLDYSEMFDTIVKWVDECEADDPNYTEYEDADGNSIEA